LTGRRGNVIYFELTLALLVALAALGGWGLVLGVSQHLESDDA
jgi:hypothetical protein